MNRAAARQKAEALVAQMTVEEAASQLRYDAPAIDLPEGSVPDTVIFRTAEQLDNLPEDVRLKKLAARALEMAQTGQYNYPRMIKRGEQGAAMLCLSRFVNAACEGIYLLNRRHMPYYKWQLRGMESLEKMAYMKEALEFLLTAENDAEGTKLKALVIEDICKEFIINLKRQNLTEGSEDYLEPHAFRILSRIQNRELRAMHIADA